jgi:hypothetical protein
MSLYKRGNKWEGYLALFPSLVCLVESHDNRRRVAGDYAEVGHVFSNHRICSDKTAFADGHIGHDEDSGADHCSFPNFNQRIAPVEPILAWDLAVGSASAA